MLDRQGMISSGITVACEVECNSIVWLGLIVKTKEVTLLNNRTIFLHMERWSFLQNNVFIVCPLFTNFNAEKFTVSMLNTNIEIHSNPYLTVWKAVASEGTFPNILTAEIRYFGKHSEENLPSICRNESLGRKRAVFPVVDFKPWAVSLVTADHCYYLKPEFKKIRLFLAQLSASGVFRNPRETHHWENGLLKFWCQISKASKNT